jgi:hypothetical protein
MASAKVEQRIEFTIEGELDAARLGEMPGVGNVQADGRGTFTLHTPDAQPTLQSLLALAGKNGFTLRGLSVVGATLEDVFIQLTGRRIRA